MGDDVEFSITGLEETQIVEEISHSLQLKGYCLLEVDSEARLESALQDVLELQEAEESFVQPPSQVLDGILGSDGSQEVAWLDDAQASHYETLHALNQDLHWVMGCTGQFCFDSFGTDAMRRSDTAVVRGGAAEDDGPELSMESCAFWMSLLFSAKLMCVYFLGPGDGKLELEPFDQDSEPITIKVRPDMLLILRCDTLAHRLKSTSKDYALCTWISAPSSASARGWNGFAEVPLEKSTAFLELSQWAEKKLEALMNLEVQGMLPEETPQNWQRWMRATYFQHTNLPVAIAGTATHSPGCNNLDSFWKTVNIGVDYAIEVPFNRWNHTEYYDPNPDSWTHSHVCTGGITRTSVRHHVFIDGVDLFDNKQFQISASEATGMEPMQKHILETSYEALLQAGYNKKSLMNSYIAVFSGSTNPEAMYVPYPQGAGAGNISQAITSNRTSFVLGCMGPSTSIDCEQASSAMALIVGCAAVTPNHEWRQKTGGHSEAAITGGVYVCVAGPFMWPRFHMHLNPFGRSFTWDQNANGYVRGEGCISVIQKPYTVKLDGEWVVTDDVTHGTIVGARMTSNGRAASLTAPSVPAMQEVIDLAMRFSCITPGEMDAVECHGCGIQMEDSAEVVALGKMLRSSVDTDAVAPLQLGAVKTNVSAQCEAASMTSFAKAMFSIKYGANPGSLHLKQLNPHLDDMEQLQLSSESLPFRDEWAFHGASARGWGGINTHIIQWFHVNSDIVRTERLGLSEPPMSFWPGGGGVLSAEAKPMTAYHIVGSWNNWKPHVLEKVDDNTYSYIVTLSMNRYETFQVWLDGDSNKVLHPGFAKAPSACKVMGPVQLDQANGLNWMIDGRVFVSPQPELPAAPEGDAAAVGSKVVDEYCTRDRGRVGDQYEVRLNVAGKYRAVSWKKVKSGSDEDLLELQGTYYVTGAFNDWGLTEMTSAEDLSLGLHTLKIGPLDEGKMEFQLVRNRDWDQRFYPPFNTIAADSWNEYEVDGPGDGGHGKNWCISAKKGDFFLIEFQRPLGSGMGDVMHIAWRRVVSA